MKESNADAVSEDNITRITTLFTAEHREECCFSCTVLSNKSDTLSFTYGDSHPTFSGKIRDGKEYRNRLYTYDEILPIIDRYGLPQDWNPDFRYGPECYVEVQAWTDRGLEKWLG